jgi:hypothetical protein
VGGEWWREAKTLSVREGEVETIGLSRDRDTVEREYGGRRSWSVRELGVDLGADRWAGLLGSTESVMSASNLGGWSVLGPTELGGWVVGGSVCWV